MTEMLYDGEALVKAFTAAKLAGQKLEAGYYFRSNEHAATVAWRVADEFFTSLLADPHCPGCTCEATP